MIEPIIPRTYDFLSINSKMSSFSFISKAKRSYSSSIMPSSISIGNSGIEWPSSIIIASNAEM